MLKPSMTLDELHAWAESNIRDCDEHIRRVEYQVEIHIHEVTR